MSPKGRGDKITPARVVDLLREEVAKTSQAATARATGLTLQTVQRYIKGIGEPTTATLQKLADYFGVSVACLRGEEEDLERRNQIIDKINNFPTDELLKMAIVSVFSDDPEVIMGSLKNKSKFTYEELEVFISSMREILGKYFLSDVLDGLHLTVFKPLIDETFKMQIDETPVGEKELEALLTDIGSKLDSEVVKPAIKELALMPASELPGIAAIIKRFRENERFNLEARKLLNNSVAHSK